MIASIMAFTTYVVDSIGPSRPYGQTANVDQGGAAVATATRSAEDAVGVIEARMNSATVWALSARYYADPAIYEAERRRIFARHWLWIGREDEVAEPGRYVTATPLPGSPSSCGAPRTVRCAVFTMSAGTAPPSC